MRAILLPLRSALLIGAGALLVPTHVSARSNTHTVVIDKMAFGTMPTDVRPGDTIVWVNRDIFRHTATARDRSFDVDLPPKASRRTVVGRTGSIAFYCRFHPGMTGLLVVSRSRR